MVATPYLFKEIERIFRNVSKSTLEFVETRNMCFNLADPFVCHFLGNISACLRDMVTILQKEWAQTLYQRTRR